MRDDRPEKLIHEARARAAKLGHHLGNFGANPNDTWYTRCLDCHAGVSVIPAQAEKDGRGYGGKAVTHRCKGKAAPAFGI